jgi:hypothetical protein
MEIIGYGVQEIEDENGRISVFSPSGSSPLFPDVYHLEMKEGTFVGVAMKR